MSTNHTARGQPPGNNAASSAERSSEDNGATTNKLSSAQCTVMCVYQASIAGMCYNVHVIWSKNLMNHCLNISVNNPSSDNHQISSCKIDLKPWHFWSKKGLKSFEVQGKRVDVFWDLRAAKFESSPEPCSDYYVALVSEEEVVLLLGDHKKEAYKRTKSRPSLADATLIYKKDNVFGKKCFATRAKFDERRKEHDIVVEISITGPKDPEMWISIDGIVLIHVTNLQWKFRGNETIRVNTIPVQVFWDVHDWLFSGQPTGHGLFIFKPAPHDYDSDLDHDKDAGSDSGSQGAGGSESGDSGYYSTYSQSRPSSTSDFCLFLYAWKLE
ncbi:PREDICTED: uncharacterized protein LOC104594441 [Nelumbo nucifera]|uniref:Uncharacterized protein LOC104594441 n=2 Tax=Nelumbo nucifera TaxID=4432 RepID=A0A1U7ZVI0_NELNU|nr:PREDICTED: uncharacterized protein LOC104594441 [Nelumbo nucifera]DAD23720.1 TPA_asm: hypothetical protein HUJ06_025183 [Nelumbo nucifera]